MHSSPRPVSAQQAPAPEKPLPPPCGQVRLGSQIAHVYSPDGLQKLEQALAAERGNSSHDLQIKG